MNKYEEYMKDRNTRSLSDAMKYKNYILSNYADLLKSKDEELYKLITVLTESNAHTFSYRTPTWRSSDELADLSLNLKKLKNCLNDITKRTFLSITPKVEDLKVVHNWIKRYNVPHYYVQVFFDVAYGISYEKILQYISNPDLEGKEYFIESDVKNQNKTTIKIHANNQSNILTRIDIPRHHSVMKELGRGRLLFYVKFEDSVSIINERGFKDLFGFELL